MKKLKSLLIVPFAFSAAIVSHAQDPSFSQFFASPLNVNPALTAQINGKWRVISNYRNQWLGPANPYTTGTVSFDSKIFQNLPGNYVDEITRIGIGGMLMYDEALGGGLKSTYASFNASGNVRLGGGDRNAGNGLKIRHRSKIEDDNIESRIGVGIGVTYGSRRIDVSKLTFEDQFTGNGFDTNLPTGETALSNMKPFVSANAGLLYSYNTGNTNFDIGVAGFHLNKPRQTFLNDDKQTLAPRYVIHSNFGTYLSDIVTLNTNGIYQYQSGASYFSVGGAVGYYLSTDENAKILNAGLWYWSSNAVIPYVGFSYGNFQVGLTYDLTISKLNEAARRSHTFELCLIFRNNNENRSNGVIPSPWK